MTPISGSTIISEPFLIPLNVEYVVAASESLTAGAGKLAVLDILKTDCAGISFGEEPCPFGGDKCLGLEAALETR